MARPVKHGKRWRIRPMNEYGVRQSLTFDTFKEAVSAIKRFEFEVEEIRTGHRPPRVLDKIFDELCDYWINNKAIYKRSGADDLSVIRCHLRPAFGRMLVRNIGVEQVDQYRANRPHLNKKTIANHLTLLITMLNLAVDLNWIIKAPKIKKPRIPLFDGDYRYLRTDEEIRRFLIAARAEDEYTFLFYAFAIYTGMRAGEIAALRKSSVSFDRRIITVQSSFGGPTKTENVRHVPILDPLLSILKEWILRTPGDLVFPNSVGNMHQESARIFQETLHRVLDRAGFQRGPRHHHIVFHDLRHTFASWWMRTPGANMDRLRRILGHKTLQMTMRYAHLAPEEFAADYGRLGQQAPGLANASITNLQADEFRKSQT